MKTAESSRNQRAGRRPAAKNPPGARGYTFVELLMSLAVMSIGVTGIIAMQKVTVTANQHAKNLAIATQVAQSWMDQLRADSVAWNHPSARQPLGNDLGQTVWLSTITATPAAWVRPAWNANRLFGPGFDAQGLPVDTSSGITGVRFCTHIRLSWLYPPAAAAGNGLMRAEVRVFWLRDGEAGLAGRPPCSPDEVPANVGAATERYHFVYDTSAIRENTAQ